MKVLVTGSSGFIGKFLLRYLKKRNIAVETFDITDGNDILNWDRLKSVDRVDCVVHLASRIFVPDSYDNPRSFFNLNINGTLNCLEYCRIKNSKLIYISSYLYGEPEYLPVDEEHVVKAFNPYAASKIESEVLCKYYYNFFSVNSLILRPFNIYGPGQTNKFLIPNIINQAKHGNISLKTDSPKRDYVYVEDFVEAIYLAITNVDLKSEVFNIASGKSYAVSEIVQIIQEALGSNRDVFYSQEMRNNEINDTQGDYTKINELLKWTPKTDIIEGLKKTVNHK